MPGTSVGVAPRRAIRRVTRIEYSSSSFVPRTMSSTIVTAAIRSAASSASPQPPTWMSSGSSSCASISAAAFAASTSRKPVASMYGSRRAARSGGSSALITAITAAPRKAAPVASSPKPGRIAAVTQTAAAATIQPSTRRTGRKRGLAGCQGWTAPPGVDMVCTLCVRAAARIMRFGGCAAGRRRFTRSA